MLLSHKTQMFKNYVSKILLRSTFQSRHALLYNSFDSLLSKRWLPACLCMVPFRRHWSQRVQSSQRCPSIYIFNIFNSKTIHNEYEINKICHIYLYVKKYCLIYIFFLHVLEYTFMLLIDRALVQERKTCIARMVL